MSILDLPAGWLAAFLPHPWRPTPRSMPINSANPAVMPRLSRTRSPSSVLSLILGYMKELALRVSLGSEGAKDEPPKSLRSVRSIAEELSSSENSVLDLGGGWQVAVTKLESPKPLTKSVELRAWRLETGEGQTLQVTKLSRVPSVRYNAEFKRHQRASESIRYLPVEERHPGNAGDVLYDGFLKHLRVALTSGTLGTRQVAEEMGLVPSQAKCWLDRAEQEGVIRKISSNPIRYGFGDVSYDDR